MMMKKKTLIFLMIVLLSFTSFTACGQESTNNDAANISPTPDTQNELYEVVLYFADKDLMNTYRVKSEVYAREGQIAKAALEAWIKGPEHEELIGLINKDVIVEYVEEVDGVAHVSFSKEIQENNLGSSGELMFVEQIAMIMEQFGYEKTQILVEGNVTETLLGHLYVGDPIVANDPESYQWIDEKEPREIVLQNMAFRIYEPTPNSTVKDRIVVRGLARVFEGTVQYEFEDGHYILDKGFTTTTNGAPEWGEFEIVIEFDNDDITNNTGTIILYEESAKDGSRINELQIPLKVEK